MRLFLAALALSVQCFAAPDSHAAAVGDLKAHARVKDEIVAKYNDGDYKAIYALATERLKKEVSEKRFVGWLADSRAATGKIVDSSLVADLAQVKYFNLTGEKKSVRLELSAASEAQYHDFDLTDLPDPAAGRSRRMLSGNPNLSAIDRHVHAAVQAFVNDPRNVGLAVGVLRQGERRIYRYGSGDLQARLLPADTLFEIASITKTFAGTLLAMAVTENKLALDDDVRRHLDGSYPNLEFQGQPIRLKHLLNHSSGLPNLFPDKPEIFQTDDFDSLPQKIIDSQKGYTRERFFDDLRKVELRAAPGSRHRYSNVAADLLAIVLERVYRQSFDELVRSRLTAPLGMRDTVLRLSEDQRARLASGYNEKGRKMPNNVAFTGAAGGLHSTAADLLAYLQFHLDEGNAAVALSHQPTFGNLDEHAIGLNWQLKRTWQGHRKIWQTGGSFGFSSLASCYPELGIAVVLLANESDPGTQQRLSELERDIVHRLLSI
ncbi:MAG TPA: serine hydrolase domain-containing protein [Paucimonas sp.]|nr:serine hydrolase domain-containing protein [Paucimonas sp.]